MLKVSTCSSVYIVPPFLVLGPYQSSKIRPVLSSLPPMYYCPYTLVPQSMQICIKCLRVVCGDLAHFTGLEIREFASLGCSRTTDMNPFYNAQGSQNPPWPFNQQQQQPQMYQNAGYSSHYVQAIMQSQAGHYQQPLAGSYRGVQFQHHPNMPGPSSQPIFRPTLPPTGNWYQPGNKRCTYRGCTFTGSHSSVETHMMDRHLIYPPGLEKRKKKNDWDADPSLKGCVNCFRSPCCATLTRQCVGNPSLFKERIYPSTTPSNSPDGSMSGKSGFLLRTRWRTRSAKWTRR
jgi:hypothetical protein